LEARKFLDAFLFSAQFNKDLLCRPRNPMLKLAHAMQHFHRTEPDYRLLHETGRQSSTSIYVVGVYCGLDKLAEGIF
jgi:dsRNA-specific ribonuclease